MNALWDFITQEAAVFGKIWKRVKNKVQSMKKYNTKHLKTVKFRSLPSAKGYVLFHNVKLEIRLIIETGCIAVLTSSDNSEEILLHISQIGV